MIMNNFSISLVNIWIVLAALGGYQLYLQMNIAGRKFYPEGFVKTLQYLTGIPALGSLALYLLDPDRLSFVFMHLPYRAHVIGILLFDAAALIIVWSHITLGQFWSAELETLPEHRLVDKGPYAFVRHPLYSSYLLLTIGFFFATSNWFVGALMLVYFIAVAARAHKEEEMLAVRLGDVYEEYREKTPRFVPFSRKRRK